MTDIIIGMGVLIITFGQKSIFGEGDFLLFAASERLIDDGIFPQEKVIRPFFVMR